MEKKKTKKGSTPKKLSTPKSKVKDKNFAPTNMAVFRVVAVVAVALVFTAGQRVGELVYFLFS
ncbi:MAG: hypothetical protein ACM3O4_02760 [Ignavibacteriales bacterium]